MGRNGMDDEAPAVEPVGPVEGREQAAQGDISLPAMGAVDSPLR
jgi:hypothetical protein